MGERFDTWNERAEIEPLITESQSRKKVTKSIKERLALKAEEEKKRIPETGKDKKE